MYLEKDDIKDISPRTNFLKQAIVLIIGDVKK